MSETSAGPELIEQVNTAPVSFLSESRSWLEFFFEGDLMHTKTVNLPQGSLFDIYVENIPHKTTVYEHPRTMILFSDPCNIEITRDGNKVIVMGTAQNPIQNLV